MYDWKAALLVVVLIVVVTMVTKRIAKLLSPTVRAASALNRDAFDQKMQKASYAANQSLNAKWIFVFWGALFAGILPFCVTLEPQPWWRYPLDVVLILFVYDFFYYLVHRFLFHDSGFLGGPLVWVHGVHHRQHNPCRRDAGFIHPLEVALGLLLYGGTIALLAFFVGRFHVASLVITWIVYSEVNLHNHDLWTWDKFPFRKMNEMSVMHHHHHARFDGGNFGSITMIFDRLFGTLDHGEGGYSGRFARK